MQLKLEKSAGKGETPRMVDQAVGQGGRAADENHVKLTYLPTSGDFQQKHQLTGTVDVC